MNVISLPLFLLTHSLKVASGFFLYLAVLNFFAKETRIEVIIPLAISVVSAAIGFSEPARPRRIAGDDEDISSDS